MDSRTLGATLVALSAASFGAMAIFARLARADGVDVSALLFLRFAIAGGVMAAVMGGTRRRWPRGRKLGLLAAMGGVGDVGQSSYYVKALA